MDRSRAVAPARREFLRRVLYAFTLRAVLVAAAITMLSAPAWAVLRFHPSVSLNVGAGVASADIVDLDRDGLRDLVVVNGTASTVTVSMGVAPGEFGVGTNYAVGANPQSVVIEDMNNDGLYDLVVTNAGDNTFSVLHGNGDGTFQPHQTHATGIGPTALLLVEVTGDGYPDVVVANSGETSLSVIPCSASGVFGTRVDIALPGTPNALTFESIDGMAGLDIAVACAPNLVALITSDNAGNFTLGTVATVGADPRGIWSTDLGDDGLMDIVTADHDANTLSLLMGDGLGGFAPATSLPMGPQPTAVLYEDMDNDGWFDLVCLQSGDGTVSVSRGRGNGVYSPRQDIAVSPSPSGMLVWDLDDDGYSDFATWDATAGTLDMRFSDPILNGAVAFAQQPTSIVAGELMSPPVRVRVTDEAGLPVADEPVWLWMEGDGQLLGAADEVLTDADGVATFANLTAQIAGTKLLWAWCTTMGSPASDTFQVSPGPLAGFYFERQPSDVVAGGFISPPVWLWAVDAFTNAIGGVTVTLALEGVGSLTGAGTRVTEPGQPLIYDSLSVDAVGTYRLIATSAPSIVGYSDAFVVFPPSATLEFASRVALATGAGCLAVAADDFNGDGIPDLAAANHQAENVSVLLGTGSGAFAPRVQYGTGLMPVFIQAVDLDLDGALDLVTANTGDRSISVLLGLGDGTFAPRTDYAVGLWPRQVAIADFNSDGLPDVAVMNGGERIISLLMGLAGGGLANAVPLATDSDPMGLAADDVDGDGHTDLIVNVSPNRTIVYHGDGLGAFTPTQWLDTVGSPSSVALAHLDDDGLLDAVVTSYSSGIAVHRGQPDGTLGPAHFYSFGLGLNGAAVADVDGDESFDLVVTNTITHQVSVLLGNGAGGLWPAQSFPAAQHPFGPAIADINQDGFADLVTADNDAATLSVFFQLRLTGATIAFETQPSSVLSGENMSPPVRVKVTNAAHEPIDGARVALTLVGPGTLTGGDATSTGPDGVAEFQLLRVDAAGSHRLIASCSPALQVTSNAFNVIVPERLFAAPRTFAVGAQPHAVAAADFNGDAALDLAVANATDNTVSVLLGNGDGTYAPKVDYPAANGPGHIRTADLNRDGRLDLVVANAGTYAFSVLLGNGNGTFQPRSDVSPGNSARSVAVGDLNLDGKLDVVTSTSGVNYLSVRLGNGDGTFGNRVDVTAAVNSSGILIHDLDRDGFPDVTTASISEDKVVVLRGNGNGTFQPGVAFDAGDQPFDLIGGDWNGDGNMDVAVANYDSNTVSVLMGNGDGTFGARTRLGSGVQPYRLAAGDLDRDGRLDIVSANMSTTISVFLGLAGGAFAAKDDYASPSSFDVALADLDSNGSLDMAAPNYSAATVSVFLNTMSLPTPTLIELLRATAGADGIRVEWRLADPAALRTCVLERAATEAGEWLAVNTAPVTEGALQVVVDADAPAGATSWYRLRGTLRSGAAFTYGPVSAEGLALVRTLELATPWPNPSRGGATLSFGLPARANVRLSLVDLQGREVALLADGVRDAGRHVALLDAADLRAGIYFVRLQSGGASLVRRFVIVR